MPDVTTVFTTTCSRGRDDACMTGSSTAATGVELRRESDNQQSDNQARRRRHSHFIPRRKSILGTIIDGEDGLLLKVDLFLQELERRLEFIESYVDLGKARDSTLSRAYATLQAVRTQCSQASGEVLGAGRRRLHIMVDTLETRYKELELPTLGLGAAAASAASASLSLHERASLGVELLEEMLSDFELRAHKLREQGLANAATAAEAFMDEGRRVANESIERAKLAVDEGIASAVRAALSLEEHIEQAVLLARARGLLLYDELPHPWQGNPHITRGYRFAETKLECVKSAFNVSNELFNIWSHALGLVLVLAVAFYSYPASRNFGLSSTTDVLVAAIFFAMACVTLICSIVWHTMNAVADVAAISTFACVDYTGISLLIAASIITTEYTAFYCDPLSRWTYIALTALLGTGGVLLPWHPFFNRPDMAWLRVCFYCGLALTGFVPILQLWLTQGPAFVVSFYSPVVKSLLAYFGGAVVYASKVPERWYPGMFDYIGGSHNLWHAAVLGGILFHYSAMQQLFAIAFHHAAGGCPAY